MPVNRPGRVARPREGTTQNIFISYRREDSAPYAGRICDHLSGLVGEDRVFMDIEDVSPGQNFVQAIDDTIATCEAAVIVIGPRWMDILRERSRAEQPDYVSREIAAALGRGIKLVPALVGGARMDQLAGLPTNLAALATHQAAELRDGTFKEDCSRLTSALGLDTGRHRMRKTIVAGAAAVAVLLIVALFVFAGPWKEYRARKSSIQRLLATGAIQTARGDSVAAFRTYQDVLKIDAGNDAAMDFQADAAMRWLRDFHVVVEEGQKAEDLAGPALAEIKTVLDAGLARAPAKESRAADILAHLGWMHWLNHRLAYKEFGNAAEKDLREALTVDASNVFAHAMLGNWLLQTRKGTAEALRHFDAALNGGKERPFVRRMQLGAMISNYDQGIRAELIKVANQMRIGGESIEEPYKRRLLTTFNPGLNSAAELRETLSAVPPADAWATFVWLEGNPSPQGEGDDEGRRLRHTFIRASTLELEGQAAEALALFEKLQKDLKQHGYTGRIASHTNAAVTRLSHSR